MAVKTDWHKLHGDAFRAARCVVTGGAGFIGSHIAEALAELGASVAVLDNLSSGRRENLPASAEFIHGSILNSDCIARACAGAQFVFHQAALASVT